MLGASSWVSHAEMSARRWSVFGESDIRNENEYRLASRVRCQGPAHAVSSHIIRDYPLIRGVDAAKSPFMIRRLPLIQPVAELRLNAILLAIALLPILSMAQDRPWIAGTVDDNGPTSFEAEQITGRPDHEVSMERDVGISRSEEHTSELQSH